MLVVCGVFLLTSCNSKKYLQEGQSFLFSNKISIKSKHKIDDAAELKEKLVGYYRQRQTRTIAGIPRHEFYYQYIESLKKRPNRKKWSEERLIKNRPVIHDSIQAAKTTEDFENYLKLRGYRSPVATFTTKTKKKETDVYYRVDPGPRMYIDTFIIATDDSSLLRIVENNMDKTVFPEGSPLDIELYNQEKLRIVDDFQNQGYARFDETYLSQLEVDTSNNYVEATMRILNENDSIFHKKYYVGDVTIYPDYSLTDTSQLYDTLIRNVLYISPDPVLTLKPEAIERNLFLHTGDLTRKDNYNQTLRNLSRMELIKFVTPTTKVDTTVIDTPRINYSLYLTRSKKINLGGNGEITYSNITLQNRRSLIGTALSANYRDLNLFKGAEILSVNFEFGWEFNFFNQDQIQDQKFVNSRNIGLGSNLSFPRFIDPLKLYHIIGSSRHDEQPALTSNRLRRWLLYDATTRLSLSYNQVDILELYKYFEINSGLSYDIVPDANRKLLIDRFAFDLFVPTPTPFFEEEVLSRSKFQQESFKKYLFTGFLFRKYLFELHAPPKRKGSYVSLIHGLEISGLEVWGINELYNKITNSEGQFALGKEDSSDEISNQIFFSQFAKAEVDFRYFYNFSSSTQLALRLNTGIASPFGFSEQVPYRKQFFVGGALSNRAWQVRELGPGGFRDTSAENTQFAFYQTGDIKLDMTLELRFPLFWYFEGALFMDAANVWLLEKDPARPNADFKFDRFLKELGIGYGFGIRLDLDFFIIRLDVGYKLHSPYVLDTGSKIYSKQFPGEGEIQIGVGYNFD